MNSEKQCANHEHVDEGVDEEDESASEHERAGEGGRWHLGAQGGGWGLAKVALLVVGLVQQLAAVVGQVEGRRVAAEGQTAGAQRAQARAGRRGRAVRRRRQHVPAPPAPRALHRVQQQRRRRQPKAQPVHHH